MTSTPKQSWRSISHSKLIRLSLLVAGEPGPQCFIFRLWPKQALGETGRSSGSDKRHLCPASIGQIMKIRPKGCSHLANRGSDTLNAKNSRLRVICLPRPWSRRVFFRNTLSPDACACSCSCSCSDAIYQDQLVVAQRLHTGFAERNLIESLH